MKFIRNSEGTIFLKDEWPHEEHFTLEALASSGITRIHDGRIIIGVANGSARYVITGVHPGLGTVIGKLDRSEINYRVDDRGERVP